MPAVPVSIPSIGGRVLIAVCGGRGAGVLLERPDDPHAAWPRHNLDDRAAIFFDVGDINGDGVDEIAWGGRELVVFTHDGAGDWRRLSKPTPDAVVRARSSAFGDVDGDGRLELLCTGVPHHVWDFHGSLDPERWTLTLIENTIGSKPDRAELADLDGGGDLDFIICEENYQRDGAGVIWHENPVVR